MANVTREKLSTCAACGAEGLVAGQRRCRVCDKLLTEDYQPLDTIRSAHKMQRIRLVTVTTEPLFAENKNHVSEAAWACVVYSLVPYLGMLFIPFAVFTGGLGYVVSIRRPHLGGGRLAVTCVSLSFLILAVQIVLWWILYLVPELNIPRLGEP